MKQIGLAALFLFILTSCVKEDPFVIKDNPFEVFPSEMKSKTLIEAFTGEWTPQNLSSSSILNTLTSNSDDVYAVQYHSDDFLETPYSDFVESNIFNNVSYFPSGSVNRTIAQGTPNAEDDLILYSPSNWPNNVDIQQAREAQCAIALETSVDENNFLNINIYTYYEEAIEQKLLLQAYIVEDGIPHQNQLNAPAQFEHNNVFRASIPSNLGIPIDLSEKPDGGRIIKTSIPGANLSSYDLSKTKVVVFIYRDIWSAQLRNILNVQACQVGGYKFWN